MKALMRADGGGNQNGMGHLSRCIAIADALQKLQIHSLFVSRDFAPGIQFIKQAGYPVVTLPTACSQDEDLAILLNHTQDMDLIVIDSHSLDSSYFIKLKEHSSAFLATLDDEMDRYLPVDALIGNAYASPSNYSNLTTHPTDLFLGPKYIPLRKMFQNLPDPEITNDLRRVLITMGGEDPNNCTQLLLEVLSQYPKTLEIDLLIGPAYAHREELVKAMTSSPHQCQIKENIKDIAHLFQQYDVALTAAGVTLWELMASGIPSVIIQTANNQRYVFEYAKKNSLGPLLSSTEKLIQAIQQIEPISIREKLSKHGQELIDGLGAERIAKNLWLGCSQKKALKELELKPAKPGLELESRYLWEWRNDPETRQMSLSQEPISWETHQKWYEETCKNPEKILLIAFENQVPCGMVRLDILSNDSATVHINISPQKRGHGLGTKLLLAACRYAWVFHGLKSLVADVKLENIASQKAFEKSGFVLLGAQENHLRYHFSFF